MPFVYYPYTTRSGTFWGKTDIFSQKSATQTGIPAVFWYFWAQKSPTVSNRAFGVNFYLNNANNSLREVTPSFE